MKIKSNERKFSKTKFISRFYIHFSIFQHSCQFCLNTYYALQMNYEHSFSRILPPGPINKISRSFSRLRYSCNCYHQNNVWDSRMITVTRRKVWTIGGVAQNIAAKIFPASFEISVFLTHFVCTHSSRSVNFTNLLVIPCRKPMCSKRKTITVLNSYRVGISITLNILKIRNRTFKLLTQLQLNTVVPRERGDNHS